MSATTFLSQFKQMNTKERLSIQFVDLPYYQDLARDKFAEIEQLPWSMLLKSSDASHENSRFDILVSQPVATVETFGAITKVMVGDEVSESDQDPFAIVNDLIENLVGFRKDSTNWPFIGGAVGYFAYDLGRRVERLPIKAENDIQAADMSIGIYDWALVVDHQEQRAAIVGNNPEFHKQWLERKVSPQEDPFTLVSNWQSNMTKQQYQDKFLSVQDYLSAGDCYQINLAQRHQAQYTGSEWQAFNLLDNQNQAPFSAFIRTNDSAIISVSPERFLQLHQNCIETKPIKGTRPRSVDVEQDKAYAEELKAATKDQAENLMIVDLLRNDIGRVATPGSVKVPKLFDYRELPCSSSFGKYGNWRVSSRILRYRPS